MDTISEFNNLCMGCMNQRENMNGVCPFCGFSESKHISTPNHLPIRTILNGKFMIGKVLGEGGFGITYLGWDLNLDIKIAIKEFYPTGLVTRMTTQTNIVSSFTGDSAEHFVTGKKRFITEAKILAKFYNLPGIVSVKDFFQENGTAYIVMEYVEGVTLKDYLIQTGGKLPAADVFDLLMPVIQSLSNIHRAGIIHRDISPDNIILTKDGNVKLIDFGAARNISMDGGKSMSVLLKPGYAPEEQYRTHGQQGAWTDVYAFCGTIYKAITGITPDEALERLQGDQLKRPSLMGITIVDYQEQALMKGLAVLKKDRYITIDELYSALYNGADETDPVEIAAEDNLKIADDPKCVAEEQPSREKLVGLANVTCEVRQKTKRTKKYAKVSILIAATLLAFGIPVIIVKNIGTRYQNAIKYIEFNQYQNAFNELTKVPYNYGDAAILAQYVSANIDLKNKNFKMAKNKFTELGDYKDSKILLNEVDYQVALVLINEKKYASACEAFTILSNENYRDSSSKLKDVISRWAQSYFDAGDFRSALVKAKSIGKETEMKMEIYIKGEENYKNASYAIAKLCFSSIEPYLDSKSYLSLVNIRLDSASLNENDYLEMSKLYEDLKKLETFKDANDILNSGKFMHFKLQGIWEDDKKNYIKLWGGNVAFSNGWHLDFNLPSNFKNGDMYELKDSSIFLGSEVDSMNKAFELRFVTDVLLDVYCVKDGNTYHLRKVSLEKTFKYFA